MALWEQEEFQPVKALLSSYREDAIRAVEVMAIGDSAENVKAAAAMLKTQLGLTKLFLELPAFVKKEELNLQQQATQKQKFAEAQESGHLTPISGGPATRRTN